MYGRGPCPKVNIQSSSFSKHSADPLKGGMICGLSIPIRQGIGTWSMYVWKGWREARARLPHSYYCRVTEREGWLLAVAALFLNNTVVSI